MKVLLKSIDQLLNITLILCMAALVINILWQVASRYLFNDPSSFTEEIARFLLLWIGMLGGCHAYRNGSHLGLNIVTEKLSDAAQASVRKLVLSVIMVFVALVLVYGGGSLVRLTLELEQTSASMGIPMGYIYSVLPLSGGLLIVYSLALWNHPPSPH